MNQFQFVVDDGGRSIAGYRGRTRDCVTRAIAITTGRPYAEVYAEINALAKQNERPGFLKRSNARTGVHMDKRWFRDYMAGLGFRWVPLMGIGTGCVVHLNADELPSEGRYILKVSGHACALVDGVVHDNHDPRRKGKRCVYGYFVYER